MSRTVRRMLSWFFVLAILVAALIGWNHVPGAGGVPEELRWLLAKDRVSTVHYNRATGLIMFADGQNPGARVELLKSLLSDTDVRIVNGGLTLLRDGFKLRSGDWWEDLQAMREAYSFWLEESSLEEKVSHLPVSLACYFVLFSPVEYTGILGAPPHSGGWRWMMAATPERSDYLARTYADKVLGHDFFGPGSVMGRLHYLDDFMVWKRGHLEPDGSTPLRAELSEQLAFDVSELEAMLVDPIDEVRWGAGRILAVAGDARGMPAFCEWLSANPGRKRRADELMTNLYGPDWRELCESGGAASQPGGGDVGGDG